jgi:hypothetical protein
LSGQIKPQEMADRQAAAAASTDGSSAS